MALIDNEEEQAARIEALEFSVNLLWQELSYIKGKLEDVRQGS